MRASKKHFRVHFLFLFLFHCLLADLTNSLICVYEGMSVLDFIQTTRSLMVCPDGMADPTVIMVVMDVSSVIVWRDAVSPMGQSTPRMMLSVVDGTFERVECFSQRMEITLVSYHIASLDCLLSTACEKEPYY